MVYDYYNFAQECSGSFQKQQSRQRITQEYNNQAKMAFSVADSMAAPKLVENCLRDFYNYLKSVQLEQLGAGGSHNNIASYDRSSLDPSLEHGFAPSTTDGSLLGDHLCYSPPQHQPQQWDKKGLKSYIKQLKHYGNLLKKQRDRFSTDNENQLLVNILTTIQSAVQQQEGSSSSSLSAKSNVISQTVGPLLESVSQLWNSVQVIDLDRLIELLHKNHGAGDAMEDQDVVLFLGAAGSGKTTCLHYLAGSMFEETEVDGFWHMQPKCVADPILATYETSSGRETVTRTLQTAQIEYHGHTLVLCDTPSLTDADGFEEDIAHGLGLVRALQRAKSVRPVLVISRDGMVCRGKNSVFSETLSSLACLMGGRSDDDNRDGNASTFIDFRSFQYVFTKYEDRHKTAIHKQFQAVWKQPHAEPGKVGLVRSCADCIIQKTTPYANVALPLAQKPVHLLNTLLLPTQPTLENPHATFQVFASTEALEKLDSQLQITLGDMTRALVKSDYSTALYRLKQMKKLGELLPEADEYSQLGVSGMLRHVSVLQEQTASALRQGEFDQVIGKLRFLYKFAREVPEAMSSAQKGLELAVQHVVDPREKTLQVLEEMREADDDNHFTALLSQLKTNLDAVTKSEVMRVEIRSIQERILHSNSSELKNIPFMPQRNGQEFCEDQVYSLVDILMTDIPDFQADWFNMEGIVKSRSTFLVALARLKEVGSALKISTGGDHANKVCDEAFSKFYAVVDKVLSRDEKTCQSKEELKIFERQAWFLTLLKEASEIYESSEEGARSYLLYQQAFHKFYCTVEHVLSNAETNFLASSNDLEAFERQSRFLALLREVSEVLQDSPGSARATSVYEQAFTLFYAVVASVLSEAETAFQPEDHSLLTLEKHARFLALLKSISAILQNSPGNERALAAYKRASKKFHLRVDTLLADVEQSYLSDRHDLDDMESICWFLALLIQGKLKYKPDVGSEEEQEVKALEQRLLTLMLRTELEVTDTMRLIREKKVLSFVKNTSSDVMTEIQFLNLAELNARRKLLVSIVNKPKFRKLLPSKIESSSVQEALVHLDKQLAKFFAGQVLSAVQEYNMVVELQKKGKKLLATTQIAVSLRDSINKAKEDFATARSWSKELATKTDSNWRRLGALKKCVDLGVVKLEKIIAKEENTYEYSCGIPGTTAFLSLCRT